MKVERICLIDPKNSGLKLILSISENIMAGIEIKILKNDKSEYKTIKTSLSPSNRTFSKELYIEPKDLHKGFMVWNVVLCSADIKTETANFELILQQNLANLRPTIPTARTISSIPPCKFNKTIEFTDSLMFMIRGL